MKKLNKRIIILGFAIICASLILLAGLGYHTEPPFPLSVKVNSGRLMESNKQNTVFEEGTGGVVIDSGLTRIIFLNKDKQANAIQPLTETTDSIIYYQDAKILNGKAYVLSCEKYIESGFVKNVKVTEYDLYGKKLRVIYEDNYENSHLSIPKISKLDKEPDGLYAVYSDQSSGKAEIIDLLSQDNECVFTFPYNSKDEIEYSDYNKKSNTLGLITSVNDVYIYKDNKYATKTQTHEEEINILDDGSYNFNNNHDKSMIGMDEISFSPLLIATTLLFWASLAFLLLFILIFIIKKRDRLKKVFIIVIICAAGISLSIYYSNTLSDSNFDNYINVLRVTSTNTNTILKSTTNLSIDNYEEYDKTKDLLTELKNNNQNFGLNIDYTLINHEDSNPDQGTIVCSTAPQKRVNTLLTLYDDSNNLVISNSADSPDNRVFVYADALNTYMVSQNLIKADDGALIGSICTSTDIFLSSSAIVKTVSDVFIFLLIIVISIVLLVSEIYGLSTSVKLKKKFISDKIKNPEIAFSRIFSFLTTFVTSFDSALMVLIAKDILSKNGNEKTAVLLGIPAMALAIGMTLGKPVYNTASKYINIKTVVIILSVSLGLTYVACFYFVMNSNFYGYVAAIFISGIFTGGLTGVKYYMPLLSPNNDIRFEISNNNALTGISGNVLSIAFAGIVANTFDSQYIYIMALAPTLCFVILGLFVFPKNKKYYKEDKKTNKSNFAETIKFLITPAFLSFAMFMLMTDTLATGYKSFLFPLFTSDAGFSKAEISNFVVFGNFVAFLINRNSKKIIKKIDFLPTSVICTLLTGLVFLSFMINDSVLWATLVIAIIMIFAKISSMANDMLWPRLCKAIDFPEQTCNKVIIYFNDFTYMIRSVILSSLVILGITAACFWMGAYMVIGAIIFAIFAKKFGFSK